MKIKIIQPLNSDQMTFNHFNKSLYQRFQQKIFEINQ